MGDTMLNTSGVEYQGGNPLISGDKDKDSLAKSPLSAAKKVREDDSYDVVIDREKSFDDIVAGAIVASKTGQDLQATIGPKAVVSVLMETKKEFEDSSKILFNLISQKATTKEEVVSSVAEINKQHAAYNTLPATAKIDYANSGGDLVSTYIRNQSRNHLRLYKAFGLVDDKGQLKKGTMAADIASELLVPDTSITNVGISADFLEKATGVPASYVSSIGDLRDYYKTLPIDKKIKFQDEFAKYLSKKNSTLNGLEATYLYDLVTQESETGALVDTTLDFVGDASQVLGAIPVIGAAFLAVGTSIKMAKMNKKLSQISSQIYRDNLNVIKEVAEKAPDIVSGAISTGKVDELAAKLKVEPIAIKKAASAVSDVSDPAIRYDLISERLKTELAASHVSSVVNSANGLKLKPEEIQQIEKKAKIKAEQEFGSAVTDMKFVTLESDEVGHTKAIFSVVSEGEDGSKIRHTIPVDVTLSDITGGIDMTSFNKATNVPLFNLFTSPVFKTNPGSEGRAFINNNRKNLYAANILSQTFKKRFQQIAGTLTGKKKKEFTKLVQEWTKKDKAPTLDDLMRDGASLDTAVAVRKYFDQMDVLFRVADKQLAAELAATGYKKSDTFGFIGRTFESSDKASKYFSNRRKKYGTKVLIDNNGKLTPIKLSKGTKVEDILDTMYSKGYTLTRAKEMLDAPDGTKAYWVLAKTSDLKDIPNSGLLTKVRNYTPLMVDGATAVIVKEVPVDLGGVKTIKRQIVGYTDTVEDMQLAEKHLAATGSKKLRMYRMDHKMPQDVMKDVVDGLFTGKFRTERSDSGKLYMLKMTKKGFKKTKPNYVDPLQAATSYIESLSRDVYFSPKVLEDQKRFLNTMAAVLPDFSPTLENFNRDYVAAALNKISDPKLKNVLQTAFDQIAAESALAHDNRIIREFASMLNDANLSGAIMKPLAMARNGLTDALLKNNIFSTIKGFTATMFLGMYNPRQFFMQASNIQNILAISPIHGSLALKDLGVLKLFDFVAAKEAITTENISGRFALAEKFLDTARKEGNVDKDFYAPMLAVWAKTGLRENVMANADFFEVADKASFEGVRVKLSQGAAAASSKVKKNSAAADPSLWYSTVFDNMFMYKAGEVMNRQVAFATAYREALKKFGQRDLLREDSEAYNWLLNRVHTLMFNMDAANKAPFQTTGAVGTALMFYQVATKSAEAFLGKDLSTAEKIRLFSAQVALWGRKSVTPYNAVARGSEIDPVQNLADSLGVDKEDAALVYSYGLMGLLSKELFGKVVDLSTTSSLQAAISGNTFESPIMKFIPAILEGEAEGRPIIPAAVVGNRVYDAFSSVVSTLRMSASGDIPVMEAVDLLAKASLSIPSSTRNSMIAMAVLNSGIRYSSSGNKLYYVPESEREQEAYLASLGVTSSDMDAVYQAMTDEREHNKFVKDAAKSYLKTVFTIEDPDALKRYTDAYISLFSSYGEAMQSEIANEVYKQLSASDKKSGIVNKLGAEALSNYLLQTSLMYKENKDGSDYSNTK